MYGLKYITYQMKLERCYVKSEHLRLNVIDGNDATEVDVHRLELTD